MLTATVARRPTQTRTVCPHRTATNAITFEDIHRDGKTLTIPAKTSVTVDDPPDLKRRFFYQTYTAILNGNGKYSTKVPAFCSRFSSGLAKLNEAQNRLVRLYNYNSRVDLTEPVIFHFTDTRLQEDDGTRMDFDIAAAANPFDDATRGEARFYGAILHVQAN